MEGRKRDEDLSVDPFLDVQDSFGLKVLLMVESCVEPVGDVDSLR